MAPHYQPCLLVWCLTIGHAFWCGASLYVISSGVVPHYRPCLLAWYLTIGHTCWSVLHVKRHFDQLSADGRGVWCYSYRGAITSDMSADPVPLSDMPALTVQLYQTCMLGSFIQIHGFLSASPSGKSSGTLQIHQTCLQIRCVSHGFVKLINYHPGRHLEYIKF